MDIPSGLNADDGQPAGCAVRADVTVTMQLPKRGILLDPGRLYCGRLVIADIGIPDCAPEPAGRPLFAMTNQDLADLLPKRAPSGNKGTFGRVLLAAGSDGMAGAAVLSARSAIRSGAGMVKVLTDARNRVIIQTAVPEALYAGYSTAEEAEAAVRVSLGWADAVAAGPGLGTGSAASAIVRCLLSEADIPLVLDADALNLIAGDPSLRALLSAHNGPVTLTPHMGEMARLTGRSVRELKQNRFAAGAEGRTDRDRGSGRPALPESEREQRARDSGQRRRAHGTYGRAARRRNGSFRGGRAGFFSSRTGR